MELKLIVLAGAKQGLEIPLKKDKFLIGRAKECSLRAGSEAISRRHCAIVRKDDAWTARDLGSRNGTYVNETRITEEVTLAPGDELRVGPLKFRIALKEVSKSVGDDSSSVVAAVAKPKKNPPIKDVADVIQRTVNKADDNMSEDDISLWLLGMPEMNGKGNLKETLTLQLEETKAHGVVPILSEPSTDAVVEGSNGDASASDVAMPADADSKASWGLFKRGKAAPDKKKPGKLPPRPDQQSKDSREAAADILREMTRRR
jgi:pSer/pThr/pTyr-binding forkhead associated (FHA) protein